MISISQNTKESKLAMALRETNDEIQQFVVANKRLTGSSYVPGK